MIYKLQLTHYFHLVQCFFQRSKLAHRTTKHSALRKLQTHITFRVTAQPLIPILSRKNPVYDVEAFLLQVSVRSVPI